jgi:hypothetical protein
VGVTHIFNGVVHPPIRVKASGEALLLEAYKGSTDAAIIEARSQAGSVLYVFDSLTADSDPGDGKLRLNSATPSLATEAYVDTMSSAGADVSALLDLMDDSTSPVNKALLFLREGATGRTAIYRVVGAVAAPAGYRKLSLTYVGGSGVGFSNGNTIGLSFALAGDQASAAGADTQVQYRSGTEFAGSADFTWNNVTKILGVNGTVQADDGQLQTVTVTGLGTFGQLSVLGAAALASLGVTGNATVGGTLGVTGLATLASASIGALTVTGNTAVEAVDFGGEVTPDVDGVRSLGSAARRVYRVHVSDRVLVGSNAGLVATATPGEIALLAGGAVRWTVSTTGDLNGAGSASFGGNVTVGGTLNVTGAVTFGSVGMGAVTMASASITGNATVGGTFGATGAATFGGNLSAAGTATVLGLVVNDDASITGTLTAGASSFASVTAGGAYINGVSTFVGDVDMDAGLSVAGMSTLASLTVSATAAITGNATVGGTLGVTGLATLGTLTAGASTLASLGVTGNATVGGTLGVTGLSTLASVSVTGASTLASLGVTNNATVGGTLGVTGLSTLASLGVPGLATLGTLAVTGNGSVTGTFGVTGLSTLGSLSVTGASTLASLGVTNNATVGGTLGVTGLSTLASLAVTNNATVGGTFGVTGLSTLGSLSAGASTLNSLAVTNNATVGGTFGVTGLSTLASLSVSGASTLWSLSVTAATALGTLTAGASTLASLGVTGNASVGGTLGVTGLSTLASLGVTNNATVGGTLGVTGLSTLASLNVTGNADVDVDLLVGAVSYLQGGAYTGTIYPQVNGAHGLGGPTLQWTTVVAAAQMAYELYTDSGNWSRAQSAWNGGYYEIGTYRAGAGAARSILITTDGVGRVIFGNDGHVMANITNTYDLGRPGNEFRNLYMSGAVAASDLTVTNAAGATITADPLTASYSRIQLKGGSVGGSSTALGVVISGGDSAGYYDADTHIFRSASATVRATLNGDGFNSSNNLFAGDGSTIARYLRLWNGAGFTYFGTEGIAGGEVAAGTGAYSAVLASAVTQSIEFAPGGTSRWKITGAGLLSPTFFGASEWTAALTLAQDFNFQLRARHGDASNDTGSRAASFGLMYTGDGSFNAGLHFYRGGGSTDGYLGFVAGSSTHARLMADGSLLIGASSNPNNAKIYAETTGAGHMAQTALQALKTNSEGKIAQVIVGYVGTLNNYYDAAAHIFRSDALASILQLDANQITACRSIFPDLNNSHVLGTVGAMWQTVAAGTFTAYDAVSTTDGANYERVSVYMSGSSAYVETQYAGTGARRDLYLSGMNVGFTTGGTLKWIIDGTQGNLFPATSLAHSLGGPGSRVATVYTHTLDAIATVQGETFHMTGVPSVAAGVASSGVFFGGIGIAHANVIWLPNERTFRFGTGSSALYTGDVYGFANIQLGGNVLAGTATNANNARGYFYQGEAGKTAFQAQANYGAGNAQVIIGYNGTLNNYYDAVTHFFRKQDGGNIFSIDSSGVLDYYGLWGDPSNYSRIRHTYAAGTLNIYGEGVGSGAAPHLHIGTAGLSNLGFFTNSLLRWAVAADGNLYPASASSFDLGLAASPVRSGYFGYDMHLGLAEGTGNLFIGGLAGSAARFRLHWSGTDAYLDSDGNFHFRDGDGSHRATIDSSGNFRIEGSLIQMGGITATFPALRRSTPGVLDIVLADQTDWAGLKADYVSTIKEIVAGTYVRTANTYIVGTLPTAASAGNGARAYITDSTVPFTGANIGAVPVGGGANHVPVVVVNGAWVIG